MRRLLPVLVKSLVATLAFAVAAEVSLRVVYTTRNAFVSYVPLPYAIADDYGPIPPWAERLQILRPDPALIWRSAPSVARAYVDIYSPIWSESDRIAVLRRFLPWLPAAFQSNPVWRVRLNRGGFRSAEFGDRKPSGTTRVACVGDSWTFGMNVDQERSYPARLATLLGERHPPALDGQAAGAGAGPPRDEPGTAAPADRFEVLNFGVLGYSSFQGLRLLERSVLAFHPDVVIVGFAMNDSEIAGYRDKDMVSDGPPGVLDRARDLLPASEVYNLLRYFALCIRFRMPSIADYMRAQAGNTGGADVDYAQMEPWTRVSPVDYERNLRRMIGLVRASGARAILLDNELWAGSPYRPTLVRVASDERVPLVDSFALIARERTRIEDELSAQLGLAPPTPVQSAPESSSAAGTIDVVFRVYRGAFRVASRMFIVGTDPALGSTVPNAVPMYDDGTHGDERAGDGVWSYRASLKRAVRVSYMYTNSGDRGRWDGLDVPHVREYTVPTGSDKTVYPPIETFGRIYMQADNWHTDARGYDLIARSLAPLVTGRRP